MLIFINQRRFKFIFLLVYIFIIVLSGCKEKTVEMSITKKITAFLDTTMLQIDHGQEEFREEYKRLTGIELEIIQPPHQQYMEKLLIQLSSGNLPDICEVSTSNLTQLVNDGVVIALDKFIEKSRYIKSIYPKFLEAVKYKDGHTYGLQSRAGGGCITYIRKDWLNNLGLSIPESWDEFVEVLRAFTISDPDGNGRNDTFGYTEPLGTDGTDWDWYNRAIMLDARIDIYFKDGRWVDGFQEPAIIRALRRYKYLYAEGLIDRELFTNKTSTARLKLCCGQVGVFTYWANHWARNLWEQARKSAGNYTEVVPIPPIEGQFYVRRIAPLLVITVGCENPGFVFTNFIDRQYDKGEIQTLFTYGVEGFHWKKNSDGTTIFLPNPKDEEKNLFRKSYVPPMAVQNDWEQPMQIDPLVLPALDIFNRHAKQDPLRAGGEYYGKYYMEITNSLKPEVFTRIILGEYTIEQGIALYKERAEKLHIDDILSELNN